MEELRYLLKQEEQAKEHEALCRRCGACCGAFDGDPCLNLSRDGNDKYYCLKYDTRLGRQQTVSGRTFNCVPIRDLFKFYPPYPDCPYFK
ncbi:MAG: hypothetical protein PHN57_08925 [Candidatus Omnitrophica bacterium]|nr:hypothetical protein [Candidatus Omnitrophota bacterium]